MGQILSKDCVRLSEDLPGLELQAGDVGVVREAWYYPNIAYEVEFAGGRRRSSLTVLLLDDQVEAAEGRN